MSTGAAAVKVLGVLDGRDMDVGLLRKWGESADRVVAADGAADWLLDAGVAPTVIVGDLDSFSGRAGDWQLVPVDDAPSYTAVRSTLTGVPSES